MAKLVSNVYGDALFELAIELGRVDEFLEEVKGISNVLAENTELAQMMNHPKITKEEKLEIIEAVFKGRVSDELTGLLRMMVEKGHYADTEDVLEYFIKRVYEHKKIGIAYVTTPMELDANQKMDVEKRLLETTGYVSFDMNFSVDAELIGGMVIRIGDRVVDSSIRTKIHQLTKELSKIQLKVGECAS